MNRPPVSSAARPDTGPPGLHVLVPAPRRHLDPRGPGVGVVIPTRNEAPNLPWLAARMPRGIREIVLVDGDSVDGTVDEARRLWPDVRVVAQTRSGKGNALACGFAAVTAEITVMIDADGSMDPGEIPHFVDALLDGADYAKGSRFARGGGSHDITRTRSAGNAVLNTLTNITYGSRFTDLCYGYNAFWTRVAPVFDLRPGTGRASRAPRQWGDGFEIETMINIRAHRAGLRIAEVASFETVRLHGESNLHAVRDGLRVLRTIAAERGRRPVAPPPPALPVPSAARATGPSAARTADAEPVAVGVGSAEGSRP